MGITGCIDPWTSGSNGGPVVFPYVPNRWLVVRFSTTQTNQWQCKLWVVQSDYLGSVVGSTASPLSGSGVTSVPLNAGSGIAISAGTELEIIDPNGVSPATVIVSLR